jgi:hypothetical protein
VHNNFISNLSGFALKIGMSANYEKRVPGTFILADFDLL